MTIWRKALRTLGMIILVMCTTHATGVTQTGTLKFNPQTTTVIPHQTFNVDIIADAAMTGVHCFKINLDFDRTLLDLHFVAEGPLMQAQGETFFFWIDTAGTYDIGACLLGSGLTADGPGVLATLTFHAEEIIGSTDLVITTTEFLDADLNPISMTSNHGVVTVIAGCCMGRVGDANAIGGDEPTIGDVSVLIDAKFIAGTCDGIVACISEGDINHSGALYPTCDDITIGDISILIDYLFITGSTLGLNDCY
jgi:hypothetical protein